MKKYVVLLLFLLSSLVFAQEKTRISVGVFTPLDVHILGALQVFDEQHPNQISMSKCACWVMTIITVS